MHKIILVVAESSAGKDKMVNTLCKELNLKQLCSYATRPKRVNEGNTHIFITPEEVSQYEDNFAVYTQIGDFQYFSTIEQFYNSDVYIIDCQGVEYMKSRQFSNLDIVTIYINVNEFERRNRALQRGDKEEVLTKRFIDEYEQFRKFKENAEFDYSICNYDFDKSYDIFKYIVRKELGV